jgi:chemotaxis protein CheD
MDYNDYEVIHVLGGQCVVSGNPDTMLITVLGSCVSACIYDPIKPIGGMNHFILPKGGDLQPSGRRLRYGDLAMQSLLEGMRSCGARRERLVAKIYGGRLRKDDNHDPGALNASFVRSFLHSEGIKVLDECLGGDVARWVTFHPTTGRVTLKESADPPIPVLAHVSNVVRTF